MEQLGPPSPHSDEHALIARLQSGDEQAFEVVYRRYYERLVSFATTLVHEQDGARDVVSDCLIALWEGRDRLHISGSLKSYLFSAVRNRAFNYLRAMKRETIRFSQTVEGDEIPGMGSMAASEDEGPLDPGAVIWEGVARLNDRARTVVTLRWQEQMPYAEIAQILETSEDAVKKVHQRAMVTLAKLLPDLLA